MRCLVIGGGGRTGRLVAERVVALGGEVLVMSRRRAARAPFPAITGDVRDEREVTAALAEPDAVVVSVEPPADAAGADAVMHEGVATVARAATARGVHVVLLSQIYVTRPEAHPAMADVIVARARGEAALRASGAPYTIVRPSWLTDEPGGRSAVRLAQGDDDDGRVTRADVAEACVRALHHPAARGRTFELYEAPGPPVADWAGAFAALAPDAPAG